MYLAFVPRKQLTNDTLHSIQKLSPHSIIY